MELRHLRYFDAVAEEGSLTLAAERRRPTAQPSLSRQIRDLDDEVPTIELVVGYLATNRSPSLKSFLSKLGTLISRVSESQHFPIDSATAK